MTTYDQLTDRDDLVVAKEELEGLYAWLSQSPTGSDKDLHGLDASITVLGKLIEKLPQSRIEVYEWEKRGDDGYLYKARTKTVGEVYEELREVLGEYPDGGEEYFGLMVNLNGSMEWPEGNIVCFSVNGSSEGDYTHVEVHNGKERTLIFLGKTFMGRDASWAFARRLADLLEVQ